MQMNNLACTLVLGTVAVLITPAAVALIIVADIFVPRSLWSSHVHSQTEVTTLKDLPCMWKTIFRGTPKTGSERAGLRLMTEMAKIPRRRHG